jgi:hypothetical protein
MKLKTKIEHSFGVDSSIFEGLDFTIQIPYESIRPKKKITEVKRKNFRKDVSTRLF